jgi:mediator of RNA polymerase II transcription subunit 13
MQSHYDPISFQQKLGASDRKYRMDGRFWFGPKKGDLQGTSMPKGCPSDIPTVGFPERGTKAKRNLPRLYNQSTWDPSSMERGLESELQSDSASSDESSKDSNDSSDELSDTNALPVHVAGVKRKRVLADDGESTSSSLEKLTLNTELEPGGSREDHAAFLQHFLSSSSDWSLAGYFSMKENSIPPSLTRREDFIQVAQLIVDQITQSSLRHKFDGLVEFDDVEGYDFSLHSAFDDGEVMGQLSRLDLRSYATMEDVAGPPHPRKDPTHSGRSNLSGSISKICPPHIRIRRGGSYLEAFPPAIAFWETFGLEPLSREKDIIPYCIYPQNIKDEADCFLERMGLVYSSANFGTHSRPNNLNLGQDGLIPWHLHALGDLNYSSVIQMLKATCETSGKRYLFLSYNFLPDKLDRKHSLKVAVKQ